MQELVTDRRAALFGAGESIGLTALITPDLERAAVGVPWQEGTEEDPAWYITD